MNADGSGLSRSDRVTCALLVAVLRRAGPDGLLVRDLPVAARTGTLAEEMQRTIAAGRVRAKTGHSRRREGPIGLGGDGAWPGSGQPTAVIAGCLRQRPERPGHDVARGDRIPGRPDVAVAVDIAGYPKVRRSPASGLGQRRRVGGPVGAPGGLVLPDRVWSRCMRKANAEGPDDRPTWVVGPGAASFVGGWPSSAVPRWTAGGAAAERQRLRGLYRALRRAFASTSG